MKSEAEIDLQITINKLVCEAREGKIHPLSARKAIVGKCKQYADEVSRESKRRHAIDFLNYMSCIEDFKDPNGLDKENVKIYDNWLKEQEEKKCKYCTIKITEGDTCFNCSIELRIKEQEEQYCPYCQATFEKCDCDEWFGNNKG